MDLDGQLRKDLTYGDKELYLTRVYPAFRYWSTKMSDEKYDATFNMPEFWNRLQEFDCHDKGVPCLAKLYDIIGEGRDSTDMFVGIHTSL